MNLSSVKALADRLGVKRNPRSQLSELSVCFSNSDNRLSDELYHSSCTCNWPRSSARTLTHDLLGGEGGWLEGGLGGLLYQMVKRPSWTRADSVWATPTGTYHAINIQWMTVKYISTKQCFLNIEDNRVHFTFTIQSVLYYVVFVISADSCTVSCVMCCANV